MSYDPSSQVQCLGSVLFGLSGRGVLEDGENVTVVRDKSMSRLQRTDGSTLFEALVSQTAGDLVLLHALVRLVSRDGASVTGTVAKLPGGDTVRLDVHVSSRLWEGTSQWKRSPAAALVFAELQPIGQTITQAITPPGTGNSEAQKFSLSNCFLELPSYAADPAPLPQLSYAADPNPLPQSDATIGQQPPSEIGSRLERLPDYIMSQVLCQLSHRDLASASSTCTAVRAQAMHTVPGLNLHLFPHQRRALQWMLERERACGEVEDLCWKGLVSSGGLPCWVCTATGQFALDPPPPLQDCKGGLFCDEPGLGKTITGLALISKTRGTIPTPLVGPGATPVKCTWVKDPTGRPAAFYTVPSAESASCAKAKGATRTSRRTSSSASQLAQQSSQLTPQSSQPLPVQQSPTPAAKRQRLDQSIGAPTDRRHSDKGQTGQSQKEQKQVHSCRVDTAADTTVDLDSSHGGNDALRASASLSQPKDVPRTNLGSLDGAEGLAEANYVWVQCDLCNKWRELPKGHQVGEEEDWVCSMHPFSSMRSCALPEDTTIVKAFADCPGYVQQQEAGGEEKNAVHFRKLLQSYSSVAKDRTSVAWWLVKQPTQAICEGVSVPSVHRKTSGWEAFLKGVGLVASEVPKQKKRRKGTEASDAETPVSGKRKRSTSKVKGCWKQPWQTASLLLDTEALLAALHSGPAEEEQRVYLSAATLLVLPPTLISHWLHQIRVHLKPNTLRVAVLAGDGGSAEDVAAGVTYWGMGRGQPPVNELAWGHDLVITTFTRLSADWTHHSASSPLKQVHWLRVILDEGHMLGASLAITNKLQMACALRADRRWVMSGTPTPSTPTSHVAHLQPLLAFLQQQPYGTHRKTWEEAVQKPFEARQTAGRVRLMALLSRIMIRAAKSDLVTIPPCHHKVTRLDFAPEHAYSYNELIEVVKLNLLLADWNDEDHNESLLSVRNSKWGKEMLRNVRLSCCVAGNCDLAVKETDVKETLELLGERLGVPQPQAEWAPWVPSTHPLAHVETTLRHGGACQQCGAIARLLVVAPCAHLFCLDCVSMDRQACPSCRKPYQMQSVSDPTRLENNPHPKWDVPMDVIEWQCSYTQKGALGLSGGAWSANWQITKSTKCVHLLRRLMDIGAVPNCPSPQGSRHQGEGLTKAIVFSQFWMHIQLISSHLRAHGVPLAVLKQDMSPKDKAAAVVTFQREGGVGVLVMDETGSVGLDLSFVSWVFLMEPLADASLQAQVTARAHRMGAAQAVHVETLVMKGTAEEHMLDVHASIPGPSSTSSSHQLQARPNTLAETLNETPPNPTATPTTHGSQREAGALDTPIGLENTSTSSKAGQDSIAAEREAGLNSDVSSRFPAGLQHGAVAGAPTAASGQEQGTQPDPPEASQQEAGGSSAATGRESSEAARRGARNSLLLSLHRVAVTELAEFQDLPMAAGTEATEAEF